MIGRLIDGRYQVRSRIARGGMATVYLATDLRLERRVAIKIMHGHLADDSKFKERFIQEARSAARLAHPNVVNVFDQGQDSDMAYLVMEYLPGITLRDLLQEHGRLTTEQTLDVLEAVLSGLSAAHKAGIVHRDLKPENVLLADDGRIKIGDFGLARAASANTATGAALLGTIAYLSPELVTRGIADTRSDIYAVGIMTYEMLTGEQPFKGEQPMQIAYQHANDSVPTPSSRNGRVPRELDELVLWATAREPDERPRDARVMLDQVLATQSELLGIGGIPSSTTAMHRTMVMPTAGPASRGGTQETQVLTSAPRHRTGPVAVDNETLLASKAQRRHRRGWWLFGLVILLAALAGGTGWYFGQGPGSLVSVPGVSGKTVTAAVTALESAGLVVSDTRQHATDPSVAKGAVKDTAPGAGSAVHKGETVALVISDGPALLPLPTLAGLQEQAAKALIVSSGFTAIDRSIRQFDAKAPAGQVLAALDPSGKNLKDRSPQTYPEQRGIQLVVSAGKLPDVRGLDPQAAIDKLQAVGLTAQVDSSAYSETVDKGLVVGVDQEKSNGTPRVFRVGDTDVKLITSKGPPLVKVPNVVGMLWADAKPLLITAGFQLNYNPLADTGNGNFAKVASLSPGGGTTQPKGSTITITFSL
nr:Stk1 family PASTA domain-containing Ser/Thr kinase [Galbitalea soli]